MADKLYAMPLYAMPLFEFPEVSRLFRRKGLGLFPTLYEWEMYLSFCQLGTTVRANIYIKETQGLVLVANGTARCSPKDVFRPERGQQIAVARALDDLVDEMKHQARLIECRGTKEQREKIKQAWRAAYRSSPPVHYEKDTSSFLAGIRKGEESLGSLVVFGY